MSTRIRELDNITIKEIHHAFFANARYGQRWISRHYARMAMAKLMRLIDQINMGQVSTAGWSKSKCRSVARKFEDALYWWLYRSACCTCTRTIPSGALWVRCAETSGHYTLWMMRMITVEALAKRGGDSVSHSRLH